MTVDSFYPQAKQLRAVFDRRFENPLHSSPERFVWDYWHVPNEYTVLRTPAYHYFPKTAYEKFHRYLVRFGREHLGCHDISPPWLSCYIEGCRQEKHQDLPHGPLAFVFSLTNWKQRAFTGGETFIVKPKTLIEPKFNRLTLFNPALVHGVRQVKGTHDPREGRLVINGWFVNPRPFWVGALNADEIGEVLGNQLAESNFSRLELGQGLISLKIEILPSGKVKKVSTIVNTLSGAQKGHSDILCKLLLNWRFPPKNSGSKLTLPLMVTP